MMLNVDFTSFGGMSGDMPEYIGNAGAVAKSAGLRSIRFR